MVLSGYYLLQGEEIVKFYREPFVDYFICETFGRKIGCGYFEFDSNRINEFNEFLSDNDYIMSGKSFYEYKNGQLLFVLKSSKSAKQKYLYYKKAYSKINKNNEKFSQVNNSNIPIGKISICGFRRYRYCNKFDYTLPYCLRVPNNINTLSKMPLYIFLHGYNCGSENAILPLMQAKNFYKRLDKLNSIVLIPSLPKSIGFPTDISGKVPFAGRDSFDGILTALLHYLINAYPIDQEKIHIIGVSNGAMGVYTQIYLHPNRYASAISIMGSINFNNLNDVNKLKTTPLWIAHSEDDKNVSIDKDLNGFSGSDIIFEMLKGKENKLIKYSRYEKGGHRIANKFFKEKDWVKWTLENTRDDFII